jgi:protein gp37
MSADSPIQWTDATWNPIRGCSLVSAGCTNCYAMGVAARFSGPGLAYEGLARRRSIRKAAVDGRSARHARVAHERSASLAEAAPDLRQLDERSVSRERERRVQLTVCSR